MTPYYDHAGITIFHGDCREVMPGLGKVDAVVTDPPFGIDWPRGTWDDSAEQYPALITWLVAEMTRLVNPGWCFVFQAMPNVAKFHEWFPDGWRLFAACKNFAQIRPTGVWHSWDPVVFWSNGKPQRNGRVNRDYFVGNVAGCFRDGNKHPCPKPIDTMQHIVSLATPDGQTVLDPFMGSGTTLRAAKDLGRKAIGIEIEERYCEIAARRLAQEVLDFGERG